jgi:hypothetical protein
MLDPIKVILAGVKLSYRNPTCILLLSKVNRDWSANQAAANKLLGLVPVSMHYRRAEDGFWRGRLQKQRAY